jgi:hypothetical protein
MQTTTPIEAAAGMTITTASGPAPTVGYLQLTLLLCISVLQPTLEVQLALAIVSRAHLLRSGRMLRPRTSRIFLRHLHTLYFPRRVPWAVPVLQVIFTGLATL